MRQSSSSVLLTTMNNCFHRHIIQRQHQLFCQQQKQQQQRKTQQHSFRLFATTTTTTSKLSSLLCTSQCHQKNYYSSNNNSNINNNNVKNIVNNINIQRYTMGTWTKIRPKRIRVITMDVTGTLVSFRGSLKEHYVGSALKCGVSFVDDDTTTIPIKNAFAQAYKECCYLYPCFGGSTMSGKEWWRKCVNRSFILSGVTMTIEQEELVFQRIYSLFGSQACYEIFEDALPFLHWAKRRNLICGVLSNADERYGDSILPMLNLSHDVLQFQLFSKNCGYEKPDTRFFAEAAMTLCEKEISIQQNNYNTNNFDKDNDPLLPSHILHIGNDYTKDFEGARRAGWHAVLLDRYNETELANEWKRRGAIVLTDLMDLCEFLGQSNCRLG